MKKYYLILFYFCFVNAFAQGPAIVEKADLNEKIYRSPQVDYKPQLTNGMLTLSNFIGDNFKFPNIKNKKIKIFASFVVEPDGSMSDIRTFYVNVSDLVAGDKIQVTKEEKRLADEKNYFTYNNEAIRVLSAFSEKWIPAKHNGKAVRCLYNYPLNFEIK